MKKIFAHNFEDIIDIENLLDSWREFLRGKRNKHDVSEFSLHLMDNILALQNDLANFTYEHGAYKAFNIFDPKPRNIHKATVRDRLLHHAIYRKLYPFFDKVFIADTFSCRLNKGTHKAINRFRRFAFKVSKNHTKTCWVLKCDIRKFFASVNHDILINILKSYILDKNIIWLLEKIVSSFSSVKSGVGLPLGNLTSQLFANIYMNELDQFIKHKLRAKYYIRYADDFVVFSEDKKWLEGKIKPIRDFLNKNLKLELHPDKLFVKTISSGVDFLGWVSFSNHRVLRTATKRRMINKMKKHKNINALNSYLGMLNHGNAYKLSAELFNNEDLAKKS